MAENVINKTFKPVSGGEVDYERLYSKAIGGYPVLDQETELRLAKECRAGKQKARDTLILSNLRLVYSIAKKYDGRGVSRNELVSAGNCGLIRAVDGFDPERGNRLSTYATPCIEQEIAKALSGNGPFHISGQMAREEKLVKKAAEKLTQELGREPTDCEIAAKAGISEKETAEILNCRQSVISMDMPYGEEGNDSIGDRIIDVNAVSPEEILEAEAAAEELRKALEKLTARQQEIIRILFGFDGKGAKTLEETGRILGISKQAVEKQSKVAMEKLKNNPAVLILRQTETI